MGNHTFALLTGVEPIALNNDKDEAEDSCLSDLKSVFEGLENKNRLISS